MDIGWVLVAAMGVAVGAFVQASTGFGFALIAAPILLLRLDVALAVAVVLLLHSVQCALVLAPAWRRIQWRPILPLIAGALIGTPIGAIVFRAAPAEVIRLLVGIVVLVSGATLLLVTPRPVAAERTGAVTAGFLSGLLNSGTGLTGPPLAIFLGNQGWEGDRFRTAMLTSFLASNLAALAILWATGQALATALEPVVILAPAVVGGVVAQRVLVGGRTVSGPRLRPAIGIFLIVTGCASIGIAVARGVA